MKVETMTLVRARFCPSLAWTRRILVVPLMLAGCTGNGPSSPNSTGASGGDESGGNDDEGPSPGADDDSASGGETGDDGSNDSGNDSGSTGGDPDGPPSVCAPGVPGTSQLPRLTRLQYDNTVRDLLGIEALSGNGGAPSSMLAPDSPGSVDQRAWDGYQNAAKTIAAQVIEDPAARGRVMTCTPSGDGSECARQIITELGRRSFRRPLTAEEIARFESLYLTRDEITATGSFDEAIELIVRGFLLSPSFLTRAEIAEVPEGQYFALGSYEVASRLSYLLWGSMPDDILFAAAEADQLSTAEEILAQAKRMLAEPRAHLRVADFHRMYAHMGPGTRWSEISRDTSLYPDFSPSQVPAMSQETERFFDHVVFEMGGSFKDLLTSPVAFVNADLAPLYGLDAGQFGSDLERIELDPVRAGVFTRVGFLASHAYFDRASPILRGAFLQKEILCTDIPPPPPNVAGTPLPTEGLTTNRERVTAQTAPTECSSCHHLVVNPTGFPLEMFDAVGAIQELDNGAPLDLTGTIPMDGSTVTVDGPQELMNALANSPQAQACYARKWVEYAYERQLTAADACTVDVLSGNLTEDGYTVINLIEDLTQTQSFRYRAMEEAQ